MTSSNGDRKAPRYPTNEEYHKIYSYCIEHKNIVQSGVSATFRVLPRTIVKEFNSDKILPYEISDHHVRKAIDLITEWQVLLTMVPMPQQTAYEDQLQIEINKKNVLIENQKIEIANLKKVSVGQLSRESIVKEAKIKCAELSRILHTVDIKITAIS